MNQISIVVWSGDGAAVLRVSSDYERAAAHARRVRVLARELLAQPMAVAARHAITEWLEDADWAERHFLETAGELHAIAGGDRM